MKNNRLFWVMIFGFLLITLVSCGGGGGEDGNTTAGGNSNSTVVVQGNLTVASGDNATQYTVFNSSQSSTPSAAGSFSTAVAKDSPTYTYAISDTGKKVYAAVSINADGSNMTINAQSTAEAMVLLCPLLIPSTGDERIKIINIARSDAAVRSLATVIDSVYGSVQDPLSDTRISDALTNAVKSVLTAWQTSNILPAKTLRQTTLKSLALIHAASASGSPLQIINNDMGALTLDNSAGTTLKLELNNTGPVGSTTNVDWVVRIVELDPAKIQWTQYGGVELQNPTHTDIDSLIKTGGYDQVTIIEGAVGSGLLQFVVDPIGKVADSINAAVFPDSSINLPHDGVYAVIALSGSPFCDPADPTEYDSVKSSAWQKSRWAEAAGINMISVAIDVAGVGTSFANAAGAAIPDISSLLEREFAAIKTDLGANPDYSISYVVGKAVDISDKLLDYLKPYIYSSLSDLHLSGLKNLFNLPIKAAKSVVDVWSGTVSASSRVLNYIYNVTPRESGYVVLGTFTGQTPTVTYSITYSGNGNTGGSVPIDTTNYQQGQNITVLGNTGNLVNTGYTFTGWNTSSDGTGTTYTQAQTFSMGSANVTLYAMWTANPTYTYSISGTIVDNNNAPLAGAAVILSGTGTGNATTDASGNYSLSGLTNGSYTVTPSKSGYTFTPANQAVMINGANATASKFIASAISAQFSQQGPKLVGTDAVGGAQQGYSVSVSADGNTAIIGGAYDNSYAGAAWVWTRSGGVWTQQGNKLVGSGAVGTAYQGRSVAISADGNTAIVGGPGDDSGTGATWIWTRTGGVWTQQGAKLAGSDAVGDAQQGTSVSMSADGNTAIVGGPGDTSDDIGAVWVWTRSGGVWTQQGPKLVGSGWVGSPPLQGCSVSLSGDGNTAIVGGANDNSQAGASWVWTRSGGVWTQQGTKLVGSVAVGNTQQGHSVSLSADGNTAIIGGFSDNSYAGAAWVWTRSGGVWTQQGSKLVGSGAAGTAWQGWIVSLSADGNTAIVGGYADNGATGAAWIWTRSGGVWTQQGTKLVGSGAVGGASQGWALSLSADGNTAIVGGYADNSYAGAVWVFSQQ